MSLTLEPILGFWPILNQFPKNQLSQVRSFMVINEDANPLDAVVITDQDKVFGFYQDENLLTKIVKLGSGKKIVQMCHGKKHMLALTNEGQVFLWNSSGINECLIKQLIEDEIESLLPTVLNFGSDAEPIAMIKCGLGHSLAVTERTGKVYAWGNVYYGEEDDDELEEYKDDNLINLVNPTKVTELEELVVVKVECGDNHSMALTDNGLVYSWGHNKYGQLGTGNYNNRTSPVKVTFDTGNDYFKDIACGSRHSLLLTEQGTVYGCGLNNVYQLGIESNQRLPLFTTFVKANIKDVQFTSIHAVANLSVAISTSGFCYFWGQNKSNKYSSPYKTNLISIDYVLGIYFPNTPISRLIQIAGSISPMASTLSKSFNDPNSSDLKFVLDGRSIYVHRLLLQISSPYYQRMLSDTWLKSDSVEINDYSYSVYYARLRYIYTGHFPQMDNLNEAIELFDLANCQLDYGLRDLCIAHLTEVVSIDNCCRLCNFAFQYKLVSFRQTTSKFIAANLNKVIISDSFDLITSDQCQEIMRSLKHFIKR